MAAVKSVQQFRFSVGTRFYISTAVYISVIRFGFFLHSRCCFNSVLHDVETVALFSIYYIVQYELRKWAPKKGGKNHHELPSARWITKKSINFSFNLLLIYLIEVEYLLDLFRSLFLLGCNRAIYLFKCLWMYRVNLNIPLSHFGWYTGFCAY